MFRILLSAVLLALTVSIAHGQPVRYITDEVKVTLRTGKSTKHEIIRLIPTATRLTVLETDEASGYSRVRTPGGAQGWVLSRYLTEEPPARLKLESAQQRLGELESTVTRLQQELTDLRTRKQEAEQERQTLAEENARLSRELAEIQRVSSNAVKIAEQNRRLRERAAQMENELQMLGQEAESLRDRSQRDWFVAGAVVVIGSMLFGILLTRVRWRRRSSWSDL